ncbi:hypothetical protein Goarm_013938, partial [Gossypium armourianum]|nr:hypothetical protein [Gossypium armourianum]
MDRRTAIDVGKALGEVVAIDSKDRNGGWTEFIRLKIKINVLSPLRRMVHLVGRDGVETICAIKYERLPTFCYICDLIGHTTQKFPKKDEALETNSLSFQYGNWLRAQTGGPNQNRGMWRNGIEILDKPSSSHDVNNGSKTGTREENENMMQKGKERAGDEESVSNSPMEKRMSKSARDGMGRFKMTGCLAVSLDGRSGGLAMLWRKGAEVTIQSYSSNHI